ncbi:Ribonuclease H2 subunit C [Echinococcus multilocularis]|uniref:Ribonuclease H2 subunit C n=1 Tax=Echinococcus multilocularis TaxID=6211 RepID=A0A087W135_ECHMU|nr:Ribonuclease H2 subunit C [Echinococcus multilocularis]
MLPASVVHSLPVNIDADGVTLEPPKEFVTAGGSSNDSGNVHTAHFRGRKLRGEVFPMPADSEVLVVQGDDLQSLEEVPSVLRVADGPMEKFMIWNTDAPNDVSEKLQSALIWSKLNASLPR